MTPTGPAVLETVSKPVKTLEELKGLKIRATGQMTEVIKALGGVPIPLEMPDVYDALRRGCHRGSHGRSFYAQVLEVRRSDEVRNGRLAARNGYYLLLGHEQEQMERPAP